MTRFYSILRLLDTYSPAVLASAIEQQGIYFRNDTFGTVKLAKDDGDAWQCRRDSLYMRKIVFHTEDEKTAHRNTKSRALILLEIYTENRALIETYKDPMMVAYQMELGNFGWNEDSLPDFLGAQKGEVSQTKESTEEQKKPPRLEQQSNAILGAIKSLEYDSLCIPRGGKAEIKTKCLENTELFTQHSFEHTWKAGKKVTPQLWEVENPAQYKNN